MRRPMRISPLRLVLLAIGLLVLAVALAALAYGLFPAQTGQVTATVAPTYFLPPAVKP